MNNQFGRPGRLYRDLNRAMISGVCAGVARQISVDPLWVRGAAVAGVIFAPMVVLPGYALAVVLVPKA
ncbi:PspC domain-containing protein [Alteromonas sediminis]|uniref:PspC domain-containing protein n=1 Tax=Alteromonas sediminis TaxID=2259342 RepID=A0A3N5Y1B1_9ALTE|nr:PspC domain-containing protein [Alteromonas sediminis]RPJ66256.1 PspC domain-containing protein [Alteromonas sediminis]